MPACVPPLPALGPADLLKLFMKWDLLLGLDPGTLGTRCWLRNCKSFIFLGFFCVSVCWPESMRSLLTLLPMLWLKILTLKLMPVAYLLGSGTWFE